MPTWNSGLVPNGFTGDDKEPLRFVGVFRTPPSLAQIAGNWTCSEYTSIRKTRLSEWIFKDPTRTRAHILPPSHVIKYHVRHHAQALAVKSCHHAAVLFDAVKAI